MIVDRLIAVSDLRRCRTASSVEITSLSDCDIPQLAVVTRILTNVHAVNTICSRPKLKRSALERRFAGARDSSASAARKPVSPHMQHFDPKGKVLQAMTYLWHDSHGNASADVRAVQLENRPIVMRSRVTSLANGQSCRNAAASWLAWSLAWWSPRRSQCLRWCRPSGWPRGRGSRSRIKGT